MIAIEDEDVENVNLFDLAGAPLPQPNGTPFALVVGSFIGETYGEDSNFQWSCHQQRQTMTHVFDNSAFQCVSISPVKPPPKEGGTAYEECVVLLGSMAAEQLSVRQHASLLSVCLALLNMVRTQMSSQFQVLYIR